MKTKTKNFNFKSKWQHGIRSNFGTKIKHTKKPKSICTAKKLSKIMKSGHFHKM